MDSAAPHQDENLPDWRWHALFTVPDGFEAQWQVLLAAAQKAEDAAILRYWARRPRSSRRADG